MVELASYAQIWQNFGVDGPVGSGQQGGALDPNDEDLGWIVGLEAKLMAFTLGYSYAVIEADSIYRGLIDADFGTGLNGTDVEGHRLSGFYNLTKNWSAGVIAQFFKAEERKQKADADLYQVDVQYKF